jgi:hypothetical protein
MLNVNKEFLAPACSRQAETVQTVQFFSWSVAAIGVLSLSKMQEQRTEVEAVFWNEILCQKWYGMLRVFE